MGKAVGLHLLLKLHLLRIQEVVVVVVTLHLPLIRVAAAVVVVVAIAHLLIQDMLHKRPLTRGNKP
jgi:hypothetical protein